jgi:hypothetical protein
MKSIGYKLLGSGQDSHVFSKDADNVIKILMPQNGMNSSAEETFFPFLAYCLHHESNPHLLKFKPINGKPFAKFDIEGTPFYQISIEKLSHIPSGSIAEAVVWLLSDLAGSISTWKEAKEKLTNSDSWDNFSGTMKPAKVVQLMRSIDLEKYKLLYNTMVDLRKLGEKKGLYWDLHTENCMMRGNTVVIVDPWFGLT